MKKNLLTLCFLASTFAYAQVPPSQIVPSASPSSSGGVVAAHSGGFNMESGTFERTSDKIFDFNSDSINLEDGTLFWKGKTFQIGNSRLVRARFERYLAMDLTDQNFENYQKILKEINALLIANNDGEKPELLKLAWSKLYDAAEYDIDNDASITIANAVYQTWRMRNEFKRLEISEIEAERAKKHAETEVVSLEKSNLRAKEAFMKSQQGVRKDRRLTQKEFSTAEMQKYVSKFAEETKKHAAIAATRGAMDASSVLQFQSQIVSFLLARKFQHASIASAFYRHLYKARAQQFEVGKEELSKFFPMSNFIPTNDVFEGLSIEARNDVREGMISVNSLYDSGQRYTALNRLMETFALGENEPTVRSFEFTKKKVLHELYLDLTALKDLGDNRDFDGVEKILEKIKEVANDFPYREVYSKVKIGKQASNLKLMAAKAAAFQGNMELATQNLKEAAEIWPLNPEIDKFSDDAVKQSIGMSKYVERFDELVERQNFREIVEKAEDIGPALKTDEKRFAQFKSIISKVSQIDIFIAQAEELDLQGNSYIAWEVLERAKRLDPSDPMLARVSSKLAPKVADYVMYLDKAKAMESLGKYASALNLYLKAKKVFPTSASCREGIERTSKAMLEAVKQSPKN